jgi:hypothetical protein
MALLDIVTTMSKRVDSFKWDKSRLGATEACGRALPYMLDDPLRKHTVRRLAGLMGRKPLALDGTFHTSYASQVLILFLNRDSIKRKERIEVAIRTKQNNIRSLIVCAEEVSEEHMQRGF